MYIFLEGKKALTKLTLTQTENKFLNELVLDCIAYRLTEPEALRYIEARFHRISETSYKQRKASVLSDKSTQVWLNHFTESDWSNITKNR